MTSYDDYFLGDIETGEIWSRDEFYKFKFEGYIVSNFMGLVSLLNCLKKENGQLKKNCKNYEWYKQYKALLNENEQLKKQHRELQIEYNDACGIIHDLRENKLDLEDENEQLKKEIMKWKEKYYFAEETVINEYSSNISKDMEELKKEVYGELE